MASWKIAYIDDSQIELRAVESALAAAGHEVTTSTRGEGIAGDLAGFHLVLIDYHLAGTTGIDVLERLKSALDPDAEKKPLFYLYTSDADVGSDYRSMGFNGRIILKGNHEALLKQVAAVQRTQALRNLRPTD
jgi:CheY-like chemotaxis protein